VITEASTNEAERSDLTQLLDRSVADGRGAVTSGRVDCGLADRHWLILERGDCPAGAKFARCCRTIVLRRCATAVAATAPTAPVPVGPAVRGVTDSGKSGSACRQTCPARQRKMAARCGSGSILLSTGSMDAGGVNGRMLKLIVADDGYEPARTAENMKQLYDKDQVFGFIGNTGTPNAAVSVPYALERRMLFFGAFQRAPASCATISRPLRIQLIVRATPRKPTPPCATW